MNRKALIALAVLLLLVAVYFYYLRHSTPQTLVLPQLVASVPSEAIAAVYVDAEALRQQPLFAQLRAAMGAGPPQESEYLRFVSETGFDYSRDLDRAVLFVLPAREAATGATQNVLAITEGRFDREKFRSYASRNGGHITPDANGEIITFDPNNSRGTLAIQAVAPNRVLLATSPELLRLPFLPNTQRGNDAGSGLQERLGRFAGAPLVAVGRARNVTPAKAPQNSLAEVLQGLARNIQWYAISARPEGEVLRVAIEGESSSAIQAVQLSVLLESAQAVLASALKDPATRREMDPSLYPIIEHIAQHGRISRDGNRVQLRVELTSSQLAGVFSSTIPAKRR